MQKYPMTKEGDSFLRKELKNLKNVERNIESMRTLDNNYVPQYPQHPQQNMPYIPSQQFVYPQIPVYPHQLYAQQHYKTPSTFKQKFGSVKEPLVILLLFSLTQSVTNFGGL